MIKTDALRMKCKAIGCLTKYFSVLNRFFNIYGFTVIYKFKDFFKRKSHIFLTSKTELIFVNLGSLEIGYIHDS